MNDPIKDFVEQHREEFDHLEAPVLKLDQLKAKFQQVPEERKRTFSILNGNRWLVAASILITLTCAWVFFYSSNKEKPLDQLARQKTNAAADKVVNAGNGRTANDAVLKGTSQVQPSLAVYAHKAERKMRKASIPARDLYARLKDSTSASSRLLAILEIEKADSIDNQMLDMFAATLNHDRNTNVRLAALSLMEKYRDNGHVSSLLISSLDNQEDPVVQLGLVSLLGKMKNIEIHDKLELLARSPDTFAAVRDEAYTILLNQNKL